MWMVVYGAWGLKTNFEKSRFEHSDSYCQTLGIPKYEHHLHTTVNNLPEFRYRCWIGGHILTLLSYIKEPSYLYYKHIKDGSKAGFVGYADWHVNKKEEKKKCLGAYL